MIGAGGIDDDIGGLRGLRKNRRVIQRAHHRLDAERANRIGLFLAERTRPVT